MSRTTGDTYEIYLGDPHPQHLTTSTDLGPYHILIDLEAVTMFIIVCLIWGLIAYIAMGLIG